MLHSVEIISAGAGSPQSRLPENSLDDLLARRVLIEAEYARLGHTFRHGRLYREVERRVTRPVLKSVLQLAGLYTRGCRNALSPVVRSLVLRFEDLPPALEGFRILHMSDFHVEGTPGLIEALLPMLGEIEADVCVLTGDYRFEDDGACDEVFPAMREIVSSIRSRFGIFAILGNHDSSEMAFRMESDVGVRMLVNEAVAVGHPSAPLWLIGVDDPFDYRTHDLGTALNDVSDHGFRVLLAHAPEIYEEAASAGIGLYLSGHTHAGQIRLPLLGAIRQNANCPRSFAYGHWKYRGMQGYTSAGVGCSSLAVRFGCPPEIVVLELRRMALE
jgi:predicted MPP superfamily phosphohydrolase